MAAPTNTFSSYNVGTGANARSVAKIVYDASPVDTPLLSAMERETATARTHEWVTDRLEATGTNAHIEGDETANTAIAARKTLNNSTQIFKKVVNVSGSQQVAAKEGGIQDEMAYQTMRRIKAIKRDVEFAMIGANNAKVDGAVGTAREMGSLDSYFVAAQVSVSTAGTASTITGAGNGNSVITKTGTNRALTESMFQSALLARWTASEKTDNLMAVSGASQKSKISGFGTNANSSVNTRFVTASEKQLVQAVDVYAADWGTVSLIPSRQCEANKVFLVDPEYLCNADFREPMVEDLAKNGDYVRKHVIWETTLVVKDPNAHYMIQDLS